MYFWNIKKLKALLIERPMTEKEVLPYLIATMLLLTLVQYFPNALHFNAWDYLEIVIASITVIVGTFWLYRKNFGDKGSHFLQRYFALGWVVTVRFIVFVTPVFIALVFLASNFGLYNAESEATNWVDTALLTVMEVFLYWYFGKHLADVASNASYRQDQI